MLCTNLDNFYLTDAELENSPSRQDGIDKETETTLRIYGAELIQEAGILLRCPQAVMATGQVLLQRFYCKKSLKEFNVKRLSAACTYLACKLEECNKKMRDIILVFDRLFKRSEGKSLTVMEIGSKEYHKAKDTIIRYERELLRAFGFIVHAEHPHKFVINYVHFLGGSKELIQLSWNVLNDSLRTSLCVRFKSEVVACGAIFYAARKLQVPLPESVPWWEVFHCTTEQLVEVVCVLHDLYQRPKAEYIHVTREPQPMPGKATTPELQARENSPLLAESTIASGPLQAPAPSQSVHVAAEPGAMPAGTAGTGLGPEHPLAAAVIKQGDGEATSTAHQDVPTTSQQQRDEDDDAGKDTAEGMSNPAGVAAEAGAGTEGTGTGVRSEASGSAATAHAAAAGIVGAGEMSAIGSGSGSASMMTGGGMTVTGTETANETGTGAARGSVTERETGNDVTEKGEMTEW
eukprot:CAMPEP_0202911798 /NCGR_PEP_ID=MMETSP1392-20130828/55951_1 /ASSEMBLY_ACC=CAM_ASM_000868 /TAXON_ID=225041 /ORGANISM="Chlamydomonas chlamydogama, Strain SAG 11-48b" /LENGTH=461 /DNA_ID=CAMNT_0049602443 /DNA_START=45 /DNA_END=1428 /DNA_ORIENTATION=+